MNNKFGIFKLALDQELELSFNNMDQEWFCSILNELESDVDNEDKQKLSNESKLTFSGRITKKNDSRHKDILLLEGNLSSEFKTYCVRSGDPMVDTLNIEVSSVFIDKALENKYGLEEEISLFVNDKEYDLYYLENNQADVLPVLHEYVFLNKNPYPKLEQ